MADIIHRGETMLVSISADDFPVTDLSDVVLTIKHGQQETQLHLDDFTLVTNPDTQVQEYQYLIGRRCLLFPVRSRKAVWVCGSV